MVQPKKKLKQTHSGVKINSVYTGLTFVFSSGWPSWSLALDSLGCRRIYSCVQDVSTAGLREAKAVVGTEGWSSEKGMLAMLHRFQESQVPSLSVFIQGPFAFIERIRLRLPLAVRSRVCAACTPRKTVGNSTFGRAGPWNTFSLGHADVGGVIDAKWKFGMLNELHNVSEVLKSSAVKASVLDYVKHTVNGTSVAVPVKPPPRISWKEKEVRVIVPCVFSKPYWVERMLTESELMDVYDLDAPHRHLIRSSSSAGAATSRDYCDGIPNRVLLRVAEWVLKSFGQTRELESTPIARQVDIKSCTDDATSGVDSNPTFVPSEKPESKSLDSANVDEELPVGMSAADAAKRQKKNDDAKVKVNEWNLRAIPPRLRDSSEEVREQMFKSFDVLRRLQLRRYRSYRSGIVGSFQRFMSEEYGKQWQKAMWKSQNRKKKKITEVVKDFRSGMDAIRRALGANFWEWSEGSTLFFWRWPREYRRAIRDGLEVFIDGELPDYWSRQRWPQDPAEKEQLKEKIRKVIQREYIRTGFALSLTGFFAVAKGDGDIRVVYDASKSGLNEAIWAPNFPMPTASTVLQAVDHNSFFGDIDLGEMFLNYMLDPQLRPYAGIDATELADELGIELKEGQRLILRWERSLMGLRSSPYNCVRIYLWSEDIIKGDRFDLDNPLRWDVVRLNLPGMKSYNPSEPRAYRYDSVNQRLAAAICSYVDDVRTAAASKEACDLTSHTVAAKINYLGQQDAARKRESASKTPGTWAGASMETNADEGVFAFISVEKWNKVRTIIAKWLARCEGQSSEVEWKVDRKELERDIGFLIHVCMTYENMMPYLKGFYLTLNLWRGQRNQEGWKNDQDDWQDIAGWMFDDQNRWKEARDGNLGKVWEDVDAPEFTTVSSRFAHDVRAFDTLFQGEEPVKLLIRGKNLWEVIYGFGDASGAGFGSSFVKAIDENKIYFRYGRWGSDLDDSSSNFRELNNLVESLEELIEVQDLKGVEIFIFTDNSTAESAFYRGSSSVKTLFELILRLKKIEVKAGLKIVMIHIAGTRMIAQGVDGLSRGCLSEGVMRGEPISGFIPLHLNAFERCSLVENWLRGWCELPGDDPFLSLTPEGWFERGHDIVGGAKNSDGVWMPEYKSGNYFWFPPPAAANICIDELRKARHKRQTSTHIFVCPRIMAPSWRRQMHRSADLILSIPPGHPAWPTEMHEPLTIAIYFPFLKSKPWQLKGSAKLLDVARQVQSLLSSDPGSERPFLCQFWKLARQLPSMSRNVVLQVLQGSRGDSVPPATSRKRSRSFVEKEGGHKQVSCRKKR